MDAYRFIEFIDRFQKKSFWVVFHEFLQLIFDIIETN